jgi:uncharacterized protein
VLDTNVFVSHFYKPRGIPSEILARAARKQFALLASPAILDELHEVLINKIGFSPEKAEESIRIVSATIELVYPFQKVETVAQDPDDNRILECALAGAASCIVTGDKRHLLPLKSFKGIPILSPAEFAKRYLQQIHTK